jgi:uncharacterized protein (DUF1697 family)
VNIGAAGTFVVRKSVGRTTLRAHLRRHLPFDTEVMICDGRDVLRLTAGDPFANQPAGPDIVPFVSVLAKRPASTAPTCLRLPPAGDWGLQVLACQDRFIVGLYRREMRAIRYLDQLERVFGSPVTTRGWNTMLAIARVLKG